MEEEEFDTNVRMLQSLKILGEHPKGLMVGEGCESCGGSGERHRTAMFEILQINDTLRAELYQGQQITATELNEVPGYYFGMSDYAGFLLERGVISARAALRSFPQTAGIMAAEAMDKATGKLET